MAATTTVTCDKCGARIIHGRTALDALTGPLRHRGRLDLCQGCGEAFASWLSTPPGSAGSAGSLAMTPPRPALATA